MQKTSPLQARPVAVTSYTPQLAPRMSLLFSTYRLSSLLCRVLRAVLPVHIHAIRYAAQFVCKFSLALHPIGPWRHVGTACMEHPVRRNPVRGTREVAHLAVKDSCPEVMRARIKRLASRTLARDVRARHLPKLDAVLLEPGLY